MLWGLLVAVSFLSGSIPFGLLIARGRGVDIRKHGSGNIGATNVGRVLGFRLGLLCFALDVLKGLIPSLAAALAGVLRASVFDGPIGARVAWLWLAVLAAAMLGHMYSPWAGFKGGKGVATGLGAMIGVWPYLAIPALAAFALWLVTVKASRYVSLASVVAALALPALVYAWALVSAARGGPAADPASLYPFYTVAAVLGLLVVWRHRGNLKRLLAGTENPVGGRGRQTPVP